MSNEDILEMIQGDAGRDPAERVQLIDQLYSQNFKMIRKQADIYSHISNSLDKDDLIQEGYFALLGAVSAYDPGKGYMFIAYLRNALKWHYMKLIRGEVETVSLDSPLSLDEELTLHDTIPDETDIEADTVEAAFLGECGRDLWKALQTLPGDQQAAFYLHTVQNMPYKDIAQKTGHKDASAARSASVKAMQTLRRLPYISRWQRYFSDEVQAAAYIHIGVAGYQRTGLSSTEKAAYKDMGIRLYDDLD